jgi:DNA polymerase elongation subunit (family B)
LLLPLPRLEKNMKEVKILAGQAYGNISLKRARMYQITAVAAAVDEGRRQTV